MDIHIYIHLPLLLHGAIVACYVCLTMRVRVSVNKLEHKQMYWI